MTSDLARLSMIALAAAGIVPVTEKMRTLRGLFVLVGIPWLVFVGVTSIDHVGKFVSDLPRGFLSPRAGSGRSTISRCTAGLPAP